MQCVYFESLWCCCIMALCFVLEEMFQEMATFVGLKCLRLLAQQDASTQRNQLPKGLSGPATPVLVSIFKLAQPQLLVPAAYSGYSKSKRLTPGPRAPA